MQNFGRKWLALACLSVAQFMLMVDDTVVNVALPTIQRDLSVSVHGLVWVVNGYILPFGGLLLLGGRLSDLLGRRRVFLAGLAIFVIASALDGMAWSVGMLLSMRAIQGIGAALVAPAGLALVATLFDTDEERTRALGIWGGLSAIGLTVGVLLGGILTDYVSWRWVFYINVPLGLAAAVGVVLLVPPARPRAPARVDFLGGITVTGGLTLLLLFLLESQTSGARDNLGILAGAVGLLIAFVVVELRSSAPMVPLQLVTRRRVLTANLLGFSIPAAFFGMFFLLTLHMQQVLGYSPTRAGLAYLGFALSAIVGIAICTKLVLRYGARRLLALGMLFSAAGLLVFTRLTAHGSYLREILPGMVLLAVGGGWSMVTVTIVALGNLDRSESGLASGLLNSSQQLGGAVGLGVLIAVATRRAAESGFGSPEAAQVAGSHAAFYVAAGISLVAAITAALFVPSGLTENVDPTLAAAPES